MPSPKMPGQRQLRVAEVVRKTLSDVLQRGDVFDPRLERTPVTISEVQMSPDLKNATVFFSPLGGVEADNILQALTENAADLKDLLAHRAHLRFVPRLRFKLDESFNEAHKINMLFKSIQPVPTSDDAETTEPEA